MAKKNNDQITNYSTGLSFLFGTMEGADIQSDSTERIYLANVDETNSNGKKTKELIRAIMTPVARTITKGKELEGINVVGFEINNIEISFSFSSYEKNRVKEKNRKKQSIKK